MNTSHEGGVLRERWWQGNAFFFKLFCGISQIELIEHTMVPVFRQCTPIPFTKSPALVKEPSQICPLCQFVAVQGFVDTITTHLIVLIPHRNHINTLTWLEANLPIVVRYASDDMVMGEVPTLANVAVLNPYMGVILRERYFHHGILYKDRGMGLTIKVHDLTLVVDKILQSHRRRNHLPRCAKVVELTTCQRKDRHLQLSQFFVEDCGVCAETTTELSIKVVWS